MKKLLLILVGIFFLINSVHAEEIVKVDMDTAINIALSKNVMYQAKKKTLKSLRKILK